MHNRRRGDRYLTVVLAVTLCLIIACDVDQSSATTDAPSTAATVQSPQPESCAAVPYVHEPTIATLGLHARIVPGPDNGAGVFLRNEGDQTLRRLVSQGQVFVLDANDNQIGAQRTTFSEVTVALRPGDATTVEFANTIDLDPHCDQEPASIPSKDLMAVVRIWLDTESFETGPFAVDLGTATRGDLTHPASAQIRVLAASSVSTSG